MYTHKGAGQSRNSHAATAVQAELCATVGARDAECQGKNQSSTRNYCKTEVTKEAMTSTADWIVFAATHNLPDEDIRPVSGGEQGWPSGALGPKTAENLKAMGILKTSIICQDAITLSAEQFEAKYARAWAKILGITSYFAHMMKRPEMQAELKKRLTAASPKTLCKRCSHGHQLLEITVPDCPPFLWIFPQHWVCYTCRATIPNQTQAFACGCCKEGECPKCYAKHAST